MTTLDKIEIINYVYYTFAKKCDKIFLYENRGIIMSGHILGIQPINITKTTYINNQEIITNIISKLCCTRETYYVNFFIRRF